MPNQQKTHMTLRRCRSWLTAAGVAALWGTCAVRSVTAGNAGSESDPGQGVHVHAEYIDGQGPALP